jgi:hypothetical protein
VILLSHSSFHPPPLHFRDAPLPCPDAELVGSVHEFLIPLSPVFSGDASSALPSLTDFSDFLERLSLLLPVYLDPRQMKLDHAEVGCLYAIVVGMRSVELGRPSLWFHPSDGDLALIDFVSLQGRVRVQGLTEELRGSPMRALSRLALCAHVWRSEKEGRSSTEERRSGVEKRSVVARLLSLTEIEPDDGCLALSTGTRTQSHIHSLTLNPGTLSGTSSTVRSHCVPANVRLPPGL